MNFCRLNIIQLKRWSQLPYLMLPVLCELGRAYEEKLEIHNTWTDVCVEEIAELIDTLERTDVKCQSEAYGICCAIMKKSTYLVDLDLWIKTAELLIYENL